MILCVGTTPTVQRTMIFNGIAINEVNRASETFDQASGKSLNVAKVLKTLGEPVLAMGFIGGETGKMIVRHLDSLQVSHDFVETGAPTRICVTVVDRGAGTATELVQEPHPVEPDAWDNLLLHVRTSMRHAKALVLSGSLPPAGRNDFYAICCAAARELGVKVILDARGLPLINALKERPFLVKPNRVELQQTLDMRVDSEAGLDMAIGELIKMGAEWALITLGAKGAILGNGKESWSVRVPRVEVVNAIGSGDSVAAGITAGLMRGMSVPEACRFGAACGVANTLTLTAGAINNKDVERLHSQVVLERR